MANLRQCPFCGEKERLSHVENITGLHYIECKRCGAAPSQLGAFDYETAIRYWNGEAMPNTNGNRLRQMTDEELADVIQCMCEYCAYQSTGCMKKECIDGAYEWLKQEVSDETV